MKTQNLLGSIVFSALLVIGVGTIKAVHIENQVGKSYPTTRFVAKKEFSGRVVNINQRELDCMASNMYFEARNQNSDLAMVAVGYTVLNRVASNKYPNDVCKVVYQGKRLSNGAYARNKCQFSWVCDGASDRPNTKHPVERKAWNKAQKLAMQVLQKRVANPIGNATMYHATYVKPYWVSAFKRVRRIEKHIFYRT
jgi:spore germination cell wall hydrolase CwlJ-like protein